jgi:signal transduction histidine kinase
VIRSELEAIDHVLRGALNTAQLNLQLLSTMLGGEASGGPFVERARAEIRRLAELLLPAALDIVGLEIKRIEPVDLRERLASTLTGHAFDGLVVLASGPSPRVSGDPDLLTLAFTHLVRNAVAATPEGGPSPRIELDADSSAAVLRVRNACREGVPSITAGSIAGRRGHLGGLLVVARIARLHGGTLEYEAMNGELVARLAIPLEGARRTWVTGHVPGT